MDSTLQAIRFLLFLPENSDGDGLGNQAGAVSNALTLLTDLNVPVIDDPGLVKGLTRLSDEYGGPIADLIPGGALKIGLRWAGNIFAGVSLLYFIVDLIQNRNNTHKVIQDALSAGAFALSLFKRQISEVFNTDPEVVERIALAMGVFSVELQVSDAIPPPNQIREMGKIVNQKTVLVVAGFHLFHLGFLQ